ncbi:MAG TPA: hypothetical protein VFS60_16395 [Thermoanaerobaculia bacterium]|nr:hypothetical protein [Thermoanaerobaculia bacterium]
MPDSAFERLDDIIEAVRVQFGPVAVAKFTKPEALRLSRLIAKVLKDQYRYEVKERFDQVADALTPVPGTDHYLMDCDTGTIIYLSVAEALGLSAEVGEIPTGGEWLHYYVVWHLHDGDLVRWDTNDAYDRTADARLAERIVGRQGMIAIFLGYRAEAWVRHGDAARGVADYRTAMYLEPASAAIANNFAWTLATRRDAQGMTLPSEALALAQFAVAKQRTPNRLDTLACTLALRGNWAEALRIEQEAMKAEPRDAIQCHLTMFEKKVSCLGEE